MAAESFKDILLFIHSASSSSVSENWTICCNEYKTSCFQFYLLIPPLNAGCHFQFRKTSLYSPIPPLEFSCEDLKALDPFKEGTAVCPGDSVVVVAPVGRLDTMILESSRVLYPSIYLKVSASQESKDDLLFLDQKISTPGSALWENCRKIFTAFESNLMYSVSAVADRFSALFRL